MSEHTKQYQFTHDSRFNFSTSYTKDDSIRYLMGDLQWQWREDVQHEEYLDDPNYPGELSFGDFLELMQESARTAFVNASALRKLRQKGKHDADDEEVTDEQFAELERELHRTTEQLELYHKYLCDIEDELAKGNQSELRIDQNKTKIQSNPYITLSSLKAWEKKNKPPEHAATSPKKPARTKMVQQEDAILAAIGQLKYEPLHLPQRIDGSLKWVKAEVWTLLKDKALEKGELLFKSEKIFDNAWQRLRKNELIREEGGSPTKIVQ